MEFLTPDVLRLVAVHLDSRSLYNLAASSSLGRQVSCHCSSLDVDLMADERLHSSLASLLQFIQRRRKAMQVCRPALGIIHYIGFSGITQTCMPWQAVSLLG